MMQPYQHLLKLIFLVTELRRMLSSSMAQHQLQNSLDKSNNHSSGNYAPDLRERVGMV